MYLYFLTVNFGDVSSRESLVKGSSGAFHCLHLKFMISAMVLILI